MFYIASELTFYDAVQNTSVSDLHLHFHLPSSTVHGRIR